MAKVRKPWWATFLFRVIVLIVGWNLIDQFLIARYVPFDRQFETALVGGTLYYLLGYVILHALLRPKSE
jgi:hypothetical protein